jgi:hypothetical protein
LIEVNETTRMDARCPGDFLSPSRNSFYPRPGPTLKHFAEQQGLAIRRAGEAFVTANRGSEDNLPPLGRALFAKFPDSKDDKILARNLIGTMIGAIPPMDANLRNILFDWLVEKSLWRHQSAMLRGLGGKPVLESFETVNDALRGPITQAMCKRPAPDLLYRTAKRKTKIRLDGRPKSLFKLNDIKAEVGDLAIVSLVSPAQWSLIKPKPEYPDGNISIVFGGTRPDTCPSQGYTYRNGTVRPDPKTPSTEPVHACPAQKMAMGAMTGILAALLEVGTIQALPASLIVKISGWPSS